MACNNESVSNFSEKQAEREHSAAVDSSVQVSLTSNVLSVKGMQSSPWELTMAAQSTQKLYIYIFSDCPAALAAFLFIDGTAITWFLMEVFDTFWYILTAYKPINYWELQFVL